MVVASSDWSHTTLPVLATVLSVVVLLHAGSRPTHLPFHLTWKKMMAQNPPEGNGNLGRELAGMLTSI